MLWAYNTDDINRGIVQTEMCFPPCADGCRVMWTYSAPTADTPSSSCLGPPTPPRTPPRQLGHITTLEQQPNPFTVGAWAARQTFQEIKCSMKAYQQLNECFMKLAFLENLSKRNAPQ